MTELEHYSYSRISSYDICPRMFWSRYIGKVEPHENRFSDNPLVCGSAMHIAIQENPEKGIEEYAKYFPVINDRHINEQMKILYYGRILNPLFCNHEHELKIESKDGFLGYIDSYDKETKTVFDFKYSNGVSRYLESPQIHLYKYFGSEVGIEVDNLAYVFIPKISIRQKKTETLEEFRERLIGELQSHKPSIQYVNYSYPKVYNFLQNKEKVLDIAKNHSDEIEYFPCKKGGLCRTCDYQYCCEENNYE